MTENQKALNPAMDLLRFNQGLISALDKNPKAETVIMTKKELRELLENLCEEMLARLFIQNSSGEYVCGDCENPVFVKPFTKEIVIKEAISEVLYEKGI